MIWGSLSHLTMCHTNDVVLYETQRRPASSLMSVVHKISGFMEKIHPSEGSEKHELIWQGTCPRDALELCDQPWRLKIKGKLSPWHAHDEDLQDKAGYFLQAPHKSMLSHDHIPPPHRTRWHRPSSCFLVPTHLLPLVKDRQRSGGAETLRLYPSCTLFSEVDLPFHTHSLYTPALMSRPSPTFSTWRTAWYLTQVFVEWLMNEWMNEMPFSPPLHSQSFLHSQHSLYTRNSHLTCS